MLKRLLVTNEHPAERALRIVLGVGLLGLTVAGPQSWWGLLGVVPLATGLLGSCPLYTLFGLSTCRTSKPAPQP